MEAKSQRLNLDNITSLPQTITENILCLLPIEEAARTSILSKEWRYKWTKIPKLVFYETNVSKKTTKKKQEYHTESEIKKMRRKLYCAIHQVLLLRQGPILEFTLSADTYHRCHKLDQIILHLSLNHPIKKFSLWLDANNWYKLPSCVLAMRHLTDLELCCVDLDNQQTFGKFVNLRSLCLFDVNISPNGLLRLLTNCPSLTRFSLFTDISNYREGCTFIELFECLPMVEDFTTLMGYIVPMLVQDPVPKEIPTSLIHLKYFCFEDIWFDDDALLFLLVLIKCSPNLEKLTLEISSNACGHEDDIYSGIMEKYSDVRLENLTELEILSFNNLKPHMAFVKFILARSTKLKKLSIICLLKDEEQLEVLNILSRAPHASSVEFLVK